MHLKFRIDWGYVFLYSRRIYHPEYCWDGHLEITDGSISGIWKANYPIVWFGPTMSPTLERLPAPEWKNSTRRGFSGIVVEAEVNENTRFKLVTASGTFQFSAEEIITRGRIVFDVGAKYSNNTVIVTRDGYYWFRPEAKPGDFVLDGCQITSLPVVNYYRMDSAQLNPQQTLEFVPLLPPPEPETGCQVLLHLQAQLRGLEADFDKMDKSFGMRGVDGSHEIPVTDELTLEVTDEAGHILTTISHFYRAHDVWCQLLEDVWGGIRSAIDSLQNPDSKHPRATAVDDQPHRPASAAPTALAADSADLPAQKRAFHWTHLCAAGGYGANCH